MCIAKTVPATLQRAGYNYIPVMKYQDTPIITAPTNIANNSRTHKTVQTVLLFRGLLWTGSLAVLKCT